MLVWPFNVFQTNVVFFFNLNGIPFLVTCLFFTFVTWLMSHSLMSYSNPCLVTYISLLPTHFQVSFLLFTVYVVRLWCIPAHMIVSHSICYTTDFTTVKLFPEMGIHQEHKSLHPMMQETDKGTSAIRTSMNINVFFRIHVLISMTESCVKCLNKQELLLHFHVWYILHMFWFHKDLPHLWPSNHLVLSPFSWKHNLARRWGTPLLAFLYNIIFQNDVSMKSQFF